MLRKFFNAYEMLANSNTTNITSASESDATSTSISWFILLVLTFFFELCFAACLLLALRYYLCKPKEKNQKNELK